MTEADCPRVFARVLYDMMDETFAAHGIGALYEDEVRLIVHECVERAYPQSVIEWYFAQGVPMLTAPTVGRAVWGAMRDIGSTGAGERL